MRTRQATDDIIQRMRIACWITKATDTHLQYLTLTDFLLKNGYANALHCYVHKYIACLLTSNPWRNI